MGRTVVPSALLFVNRQTLIVVSGAGLILGATAFFLMGPEPAPVEFIAPVEKPAAPPPVKAPPRPAARPATEPVRRAPAPKAEASAPAEAPVAAVADTGTLTIDSDVPGAQVFIDREYVGVTPVTAPNIAPGAHRINISAQGFEGLAEEVDVEPGPRGLMFRFKEVRLDVVLDVVHKHRIGSCKGRLVATTQGLRYETSDKDDAFTAQLESLETFEVDYLKKNLKIRAKNGKGYDFTDPEGNADHLFVFHRDVEKARDRLRKGDQPAQ